MSQESAFNPFATAQAEFDRIADLIGLDAGARQMLRSTQREYHFNIPVRMDDGTVQVFPGQHGPRPGHVDDLEVRCRGSSPGRRQRRSYLRSPQPESP